jgi:hypothetical protein
MMTAEMNENSRHFLDELCKQTDSDLSTQASMYDIGAAVGLDRDAAKFVAEELIGKGFAEIKTLNGGISITLEGIEKTRILNGKLETPDHNKFSLGDAVILEGTQRLGVEQVVAELKRQSGNLGLDFDALTELVSDLSTIESQFMSSRPKTSIIRECFRSIKGVLEKTGSQEIIEKIKQWLGE